MKPPRPSLIHKIKVDAHAAWLTARDPRCPWPARLVGLVVTAYALSPIDLIPDFIPILGLVDDAILIPAGLWLFIRMLPPGLFEEHKKEAEAASERPGSGAGALIVIGVWVVATVLVLRLLGYDYR